MKDYEIFLQITGTSMDSNDSANTTSTTDNVHNSAGSQKSKPAVSVTTGGLGKGWESGKKAGFFKKVKHSL